MILRMNSDGKRNNGEGSGNRTVKMDGQGKKRNRTE